ncbi:AQR1 [Symbiodinium sp. CCMP2592]|nr:AQR1 [Symbiodinium sp. CCMP2592]
MFDKPVMRGAKYARRKRGKWKALITGLMLVCCVEGLATAAAGMHRTLKANPCETLQRENKDLRKELTLQEIQKENEDLRKELKKLPWPMLKYFWANGRTYSLPLRAESRDLSHRPAQARLEYLAGFFDGDGYVGCETRLTGAALKVSQSFDQAEVLMLFRQTFGGSISRERRGVGLGKPKLQWQAYGQSARRAVRLLALHSITKQKQLLIAARWPKTKSLREDRKAELCALKQYDSAVAGPCSWSYFAGFFDAEGCIRLDPRVASLQVKVSQKHPRALRSLRAFLQTTSGIDATLGNFTGYGYELWVCSLSKCKEILQHLLDAGLLCKVQQAQLALSLTPENAAEVRAELASRSGNQRFGRRLDAAGQNRARKILSAQRQVACLCRRGLEAEADAKQREVARLKDEHELRKARYENQQLLEYIEYIRHLHENSWEGPLLPGM